MTFANQEMRTHSGKSNTAIIFLIFAIVGSAFISGCNISWHHSKSVKNIDTSQLVAHMNKKKIDTTHAFYFSAAGMKEAIDAGFNRILKFSILDNSGNLYSIYPDSSTCSGHLISFFNDYFNPEKLYKIENNTLLPILNNSDCLMDLNDRQFSESETILEKSDYTVVLFWSSQIGKNKRLRNWQQHIEEKDGFQYVTINLDPHLNWNWENISKNEND